MKDPDFRKDEDHGSFLYIRVFGEVVTEIEIDIFYTKS